MKFGSNLCVKFMVTAICSEPMTVGPARFYINPFI